MGRLDETFEHRGMWYFLPGFFEYALGPWQPTMPTNPDLVSLWKQAIDWYADNGLNFVVIQLGPYSGDRVPIGPDRIRFGWGYHYVLGFERFPEARCLPDDFVKRNRDIVRAVTEYGREKGVDVFTHHYNFMAPRPFVEAHRELTRLECLRRGNVVDAGQNLKCWDGRGLLCADMCWNRPLYREFLLACFEEFCELFPAAAGILVTPGERARCQCVDCIGEQPSARAASIARYRDGAQKRRTIANFVTEFAATLRRSGKTPLVRSWIAGVDEEWVDVLPKGVTYVTKYSVFDLTDGGPDPAVLPWIESGHDMWLMKEITGCENAGPMLLTPPEAFDQISDRCRELGVRGVMGVANAEWGLLYRQTAVQQVNETLFANAVGERRGTARDVADGCYGGIFGESGPAILRSLGKCMQIPFTMSRLIGEPIEGFTAEFSYHFADFFGKLRGWPGTIGAGPPPADWLRRDIAPLQEFVAYLKEHPWTDDFRASVTGGRTDPIEFLWERLRDAECGLAGLRCLASSASPGAERDLELVLISGEMGVLIARQWHHWFLARLFRSGARGSAPEPVRRGLANRAVAEYEAGMEALRARRPLLERLESLGVIDPELAVDRYFRRDLSLREENELPALRRELAALLGERGKSTGLYGGYPEVCAEATGFFRVEKVGGRWWFITPDGSGFISAGMNHVDYRRDYSAEFVRFVVGYLRDWGFNTIGWSQESMTHGPGPKRHSAGWCQEQYHVARMPYVHLLRFTDMEWYVDACFPDVVGPGWEEHCDRVARNACTALRDDPYLIGYFYSDTPNLPLWRERCRRDGRAFEAVLRRYYGTIASAVRRHDPNHLLLGDRYKADAVIPLGGERVPGVLGEALVAMAETVDVLSLEYYRPEACLEENLDRWHRLCGKPVLLADSAFLAPTDALQVDPASPVYVPDQAARGEAYRAFARRVYGNPLVVGWHWCAFGRSVGRRSGLLDGDGRPYAECVDRMREFNADELYRVATEAGGSDT